MLTPETIDEVLEAVRDSETVIPVAGLSKPALSAVEDSYDRLSLLNLDGVVEYEPSEFTITVLAGTKLSDLQQVLDEQGQYLPFDPPLASAGATIGGTVAAGLNGPGAFRFGPIRDFLIGVRYVDGEGKLIRGGGKVVKNAAGFDTPKFLIGSLGRLGVMVELSFKVFPQAESQSTFSLSVEGAAQAADFISQLSRHPLELNALDYAPEKQLVYGRFAGSKEAMDDRLEKIDKTLTTSNSPAVLSNSEADDFWRDQLDFAWINSDQALAKFAITPSTLAEFDALLEELGAARHYTCGANTAWVNAPAEVFDSDDFAIPGLIFQSPAASTSPWTTCSPQTYQIQTDLKQAMDSCHKFPALYPGPCKALSH